MNSNSPLRTLGKLVVVIPFLPFGLIGFVAGMVWCNVVNGYLWAESLLSSFPANEKRSTP